MLLELLDLVPDFFYVHTYDMRFWYANKHAADYFGVGKREIVGRRLDEVDPDSVQAQRFIEVCQRIMREGKSRLTDGLAYRRKDGRAGYLRQHDIPFKNPVSGEPMLLGISRDVTAERELLEERVRRAELERELELAREIQRSLRPASHPKVEGMRFAAYSEPATYAGGDFYDWWKTPDGRVIVCIGDVTGHGVGPALLASECRAYARVLLSQHPLERAFPMLGELLTPDLGESKFVTFATLELDPSMRRARLLSAGHGPMLVVSSGGERIDALDTHGPPLGVVPGTPLDRPTEVRLSPGDWLILLSDGVYEARSEAGQQFGHRRLHTSLANLASCEPDQLVERLVDEVCAYCGDASPADDVTLIATRAEA